MGKRGPQPKELDWVRLDQYLELGAGLLDCTEFLQCSDDKIQKDIRKKFDLTFTQYRQKKLSKMRVKLLQKQFEVAMGGNVSMLIWLGKQVLGQTDKLEQTTETTQVQRLVINMGDNE